MDRNIFLLSAVAQSGKTTLLQSFCKKYSQTGGILTPIVSGQRVFYNIGNKEVFSMEAEGGEERLCVGKYFFSAAAFDKASQILLSASKQNSNHYLVVDEIGPLEIEMKLGFYDAVREILQEQLFHTLILVVRPSLIPAVNNLSGLVNPLVLGTAEFKQHFGL